MTRAIFTGLLLPLLLLASCGDRTAAPARQESAPAEASATPDAAEPTEAARATPTQAEDEEARSAEVGRPAPDFTLTDQAGGEHRLSQYRGRIVILEWVNPRCPYVRRHYEAQTMTRLEQSYPDGEVQWLAVDSSHFVQPADSQAFREQHHLAYPILQDPEGRVGRLYGARTTPHMFVIDAEGVLRYAGAIDDDPRGRSTGATNHVDQAVSALRRGAAPPISQTEPYGCTVKYEGATAHLTRPVSSSAWVKSASASASSRAGGRSSTGRSSS